MAIKKEANNNSNINSEKIVFPVSENIEKITSLTFVEYSDNEVDNYSSIGVIEIIPTEVDILIEEIETPVKDSTEIPTTIVELLTVTESGVHSTITNVIKENVTTYNTEFEYTTEEVSSNVELFSTVVPENTIDLNDLSSTAVTFKTKPTQKRTTSSTTTTTTTITTTITSTKSISESDSTITSSTSTTTSTNDFIDPTTTSTIVDIINTTTPTTTPTTITTTSPTTTPTTITTTTAAIASSSVPLPDYSDYYHEKVLFDNLSYLDIVYSENYKIKNCILSDFDYIKNSISFNAIMYCGSIYLKKKYRKIPYKNR